jgi:hypothetical protein
MDPTTVLTDLDTSPAAERRLRDRRGDIAQFRLISRVFAMRRAFGAATAHVLLLRMGIGEERARHILSLGGERRLKRRRC